MKELMKQYIKPSTAFVSIPLMSSEWDTLATDVIKKDTGVDLTGRLHSNYDDETGSVYLVIEEDKMTEDEMDKLGPVYRFDEWFTSNDNVLYQIFDQRYVHVDITFPLDEYDEPPSYEDTLYIISMPLDVYNQLYT